MLSANPEVGVVLDILKLRLAGGEYAVKAAHAAMLHMGTRGYLQKSPAQRRLRESYVIAIVTPATKHLRREIARIEPDEQGAGATAPAGGATGRDCRRSPTVPMLEASQCGTQATAP